MVKQDRETKREEKLCVEEFDFSSAFGTFSFEVTNHPLCQMVNLHFPKTTHGALIYERTCWLSY